MSVSDALGLFSVTSSTFAGSVSIVTQKLEEKQKYAIKHVVNVRGCI